eukprot:scaffold25052_cov110-Isochrysis_galbana.AAC.5
MEKALTLTRDVNNYGHCSHYNAQQTRQGTPQKEAPARGGEKARRSALSAPSPAYVLQYVQPFTLTTAATATTDCEQRTTSFMSASSDEAETDFTTLPRRFRALLQDPSTCAIEAFDRSLDCLARASCEPCTATHWCACQVVAAEAALLGSELAQSSLRRVLTTAQACSFIARWRRWIRATEHMHAGAVGTTALADRSQHQSWPIFPPTWELLLRPAYLSYDTRRFDFRGLLLRIFADVIAEGGDPSRGSGAGESVGAGTGGGDPLAMLHQTPFGARERGYARASSLPREELIQRPSPLNEATRYGCGGLNKLFKRSPLFDDFMALYRELVREWVAPQLGATELLYQARPIFRVLLPEHLAVGPRHRDAAYHSQPNEINYWLPFTDAHDTNSLQVESEPGAGDFAPITCGYGGVYRFYGNGCEHLNELNLTGATRVSLDFRVIRSAEEASCPVPTADMAADGGKGEQRYFSEGRYYERMVVG